MKVGLVLEGGAMRGMYTAGILDSFLDKGIEVDCVVGTSAGALFGVNLLSRQRGRAVRYNKRFNGDKDYMGIKPFLKEGNFISTKYAYEDVPERLDPFDVEAFKESGIPFYAVATNLETGKAEYLLFSKGFEEMDILRASGSMPFVSRPVEIGGQLYLDGGVADSIPFQWMYEQGCDKIIVILTQPMEYRKKPMNSLGCKLCYRKYPKFVKSLLNRHNVYNNSVALLKEWEDAGRAFVIRPTEALAISRIETNPDILQEVYDFGLADFKRYEDDLIKYLEK